MMEENRRKQENSVNLVDLFFYLLSYWYWFVPDWLTTNMQRHLLYIVVMQR